MASNIVGYSTFNLTAGKQDIGGVPFVNVGGDALDVQKITLSAGTDGTDWLMVFNPLTRAYDTLTYWDVVWSGGEDDPDAYEIGPGWGDDMGTVIYKDLDAGQGFWIQTENDCTVTLPGQVCEATDNTYDLTAGKQDILACCFPVVCDVQTITLSAGTDGTDWLMVFNPQTRGYDTLTYWDIVWSGGEDDPDAYEIGPGWGDDMGTVIYKNLNPGQGFWIQTENDCTVTFSAPTGL